ncbi:RHS repeat-associated core domain protein [Fluviicola taffensis DSM 16823]|uniref:RHS repeat-associated core domain protein n=2 Tax=Fluviicola TaxID=332102 RepID=F2IHF8_FLUTR|nr:RHS repeat-associated core domain protein [Fluviicola taffensis DSM 16823]
MMAMRVIGFEYTDPIKEESSYLAGLCSDKQEQMVPKHREWSSFSQTDRASSLMRELAYLQKIITPSQEIDFTISERYDVNHDYYTKPANRVGNDYYYENRKYCAVQGNSTDFDIEYPVETMKYDEIKIKSRLVNPKLYPNENQEIGTIKFNYAAKGSAQELAVSSYLIRNNDKQEKVISGTLIGTPSRTQPFNIEEYKNNGVDKRGKTTLLGLEFYGTNVSSTEKNEYKFQYGYNPSFDEFHKREIARAFHFPSLRQGSSSNNHVIPHSKADALMNYSELVFTELATSSNVTRTGMSAYDFLIDFPYQEIEYKFDGNANIANYVSSGSTTADYTLTAVPKSHGVNPIMDMYGYFYIPNRPDASTAWSLTKITYPTGGEVTFKYEPAAFTPSITPYIPTNEWNIRPSNIPIISRYNEIAKRRSFIQDAYNRNNTLGYYPNTGLFPKHLTPTFEFDLPLNYGIRLKEKVTNDKINPTVKITYEYENGTFTALPSEFIQNVIGGFNHFISRENHIHSIEAEKYYISDPNWDYDFAEKMAEVAHTNISLDDYSSVFFYQKIRTKNSDNSLIERQYGAALDSVGIFPEYNFYCSIMGGGSFWQGSYLIGGNNLLKSPISLKSESYFEANSASPYKKVEYNYERFELSEFYQNIRFYYGGYANGPGSMILWDVNFEYYRPFTNNNTPPNTTYRIVPNVVTSSFCRIGQQSANNIEGISNAYAKWVSSKMYLKKETTNYKGIISNVHYMYDAAADQKVILREVKKETLNEPLIYITKYKYAFEEYGGITSKFRDLNLFAPPYRTTTYLNSSIPANTLSDQVTTYDLTPDIPKPLDAYSYETTGINPITGTFTPTTFSTSDPNWRVSESDIYEYNQAAMPVSTRSNQLYTKVVTGNGSNTVKATILGTERPFDATYTGFEDFKTADNMLSWNPDSYLQEDWFTSNTRTIEVPAAIKTINQLDVCDVSNTSTAPGLGQPLYLRVTVDDITNLQIGNQVTLTYTTPQNGNTQTTSILQIDDIQPKAVSSYPSGGDLNYFVCFTTQPLPNGLPLNNYTNVKITKENPHYNLTSTYSRTGKYSYQLGSVREEGADPKKTPVRLVKISQLPLATECNLYEGPGDGGVLSRNPNVPSSCYWDYQASLWIKYDTDFASMNPPIVPSTSFSDDAVADGIYRRGEVSTSTDQGVRIVCKVWNSNRTGVNEQFIFYPQSLGVAWQQFTIDFSVFKGPLQWVEVYVENNRNQVGSPILTYRSAFVDDIIVSPKEVKYEYSVTNNIGNQTFQINNNDVFVQSTFDSKGRNTTTRNAYGRVLQELTYFDQANWTHTNNYVTEVKWISNGLFNTTRYFMDGFGRTKQVQSSDHVRNLRAVSETSIYNDKGQISRSYKPYYANNYGLNTKYDAGFITQTQALYGSNYPYTDVTFEPKPESVVSSVSAPRSNTESAVISSQTEYMNAAALTHISANGTNTFPAGALLIHQTVNPVGKITRTYMNRLGQVILEEHQIGMDYTQNTDGSISFTTSDLGFAQTWFYYDGAGRIVETYDPENKRSSYFYNSLGVIVKTISPDKGTSELRYDKYGQVRFIRNQKDIDATANSIYGTSQFKYIKYDKWGQNLESGVVTAAPNDLGVSTTNPPFPTGDFFTDYAKINNQNYPQATDKFVQVHIKNSYTGTRKFYNSTVITEQYTYSQHLLNTTSYSYSPAKTDQVTKSYMADGQIAKTAYLYDGLAGTHEVTAIYNELNLPIGKDYNNSVNSASNFKWRTAVDIFGRVRFNTNTYNNTTTQVSKNYYDPLGNLLLVGLGTTASTTDPHIDYLSIKKNIREQMVAQMSKNYRVGLTYDAAGNITNQYWSNEQFDPATASSTNINQYQYTYDKMNRLIGADYKQSTMTSNPFSYFTALKANIPSDFACSLDGEVAMFVFKPYYEKFEANIRNGVEVARSRSSIEVLKQLQSDYINNNVQYADMTPGQIDEFLIQFIGNCNKNRLKPLDFEYCEAKEANDNAHRNYLINNPHPTPLALKYMKILLLKIPYTAPVNCMQNPTATAYGYLQNFPTPVASSNSIKYDAAYWYQKNGNFDLLNRNDDGGVKTQQTYSYEPNTNKLIQASFQVNQGTIVPYDYTYDKNGNLLTDPKNQTMNFAYSLFDDLPVSMTNTNGDHNYRYFGGGRSVKEISPTDREYYIDQVILDQNGTVKSYQTASGYATPNGSTASYFYQVKDWLGSQHITLNAAGTIQNAMDYYPYGKVLPNRNTFATNHEGYRYQYTGHERDGETNYQYHGARYYDEDLARYMSVDPWADKYPAWSTYNYVMGNPIKFIDPTGKGVEYTKDEATAMAARGVTNGYKTEVVANPDKPDDYGVNYKRTVDGKEYEGVQYDGKFDGIVKGGLQKYQGVNDQNNSQSTLEKTKIGISTVGTIADLTDNSFGKLASNKTQWKISYDISKNLKSSGLGLKVKPSAIKNGIPKVLKGGSKALGWAGGVITVGEVVYNGNLKASNMLDATVTGVSFIPVYGWAAGGIYFLADVITKEASGKSIGEHLDGVIDNNFGTKGGVLIDF